MIHRKLRVPRASFSVLSLATFLFAGSLSAAEPAADPEAPLARTSSPEKGRASALALEVHFDFDASAPDQETVRRALESELNAPVHVTEGDRGLRLVIRDHTLEARFVPDTGTPSERKIALPEDPSRAIEMIALLSGNLVRDEAGELLARLRKPETIEESPPPQETSSEPTPKKDPLDAKEGEIEEIESEESEEEESESDAEEDDDLPMLAKAPFDVTLLSPISLHPDLYRRETSFSLGVLYTDVGQVRGLALNGIGLLNRGGGRGLEVAGIWSVTNGPFRGARFSGLVDVGSDKATGLVVGGLVSHQSGPVTGLQVGAIFARSKDKLVGEQLGLINVAGAVEGAQIGLVNYAGGNVKGAQIGLINIGRGMTGAGIGLININPDIDVHFVSWASAHYVPRGNAQLADAIMGHVGVQYQSEHFYSLIGFGISGRDTTCGPPCAEEAVLAPGFGFGYHQDISERVYAEADVYNQWEVTTRSGTTNQATLGRVSVGFEVLPSLAVFAGAGPRLDQDFETERVGGSPHFFGGIRLF